MSSVEKRTRNGQLSWRAHYRDPAGRQRSKSFRRKVDAERFLTTVEASKLTGSYVEAAADRVTVGVWADRWLSARSNLKPSTRARYEGVLGKQISPRWGNVPLSAVSHSDVAGWVGDLSGSRLAPATVRYVHRVFALLMEMAVRDGRIARNPATGVQLPKVTAAPKRFLTPAEVDALADAAGQYRLVILTLAYCGLRWGELAALRVGRVDSMRRRLEVTEAVTEVRGRLTWGSPKSHQVRSVPMPRFLADDLAAHVAGSSPEELVFVGMRGGVLRNLNFRRDVFDRAATAAGLEGLTPHELRHTAASLAVASGASVKAVQRMLGHASAAMTLDVYAGLFEDDLDGVADRMDALGRSAVAPPLPKATIVDLDAVRERVAGQ